MFSKALFKQSCKANGLMWGIVTFATCFMLACVMLITGGGNIAEIKNGISDTILDSTIESNMEDRALNYYSISDTALLKFTEFYEDEYVDNGGNANLAYATALTQLQSYTETYTTSLGYEKESEEAQEIQGVIFYTLNPKTAETPNGMYENFYIGLGESSPVFDLTLALDSNGRQYISEYVKTNSSIFLAGNMVSERNISMILEKLKSFNVDEKKYAKFGYSGLEGYNNIKSISENSIVTYRVRLDLEISRIDTTGKTAEELNLLYKEADMNLKKELTSSFITDLPENVSKALTELGQMDMFSMIVGSIFFKMAGLLLPIIYMIMTANALIAGQVDSGSMAYILSSSTKRRQVTITQAAYLITSLFAMFTFTTITSLICFRIIRIDVTLKYTDILLLNLGAFLTLFAMSGICFLASCFFNRSKNSMSIGGGINMFFLVATMLGLFGSKILPSVIRLKSLNFFNYVSIITLFDEISIFNGTTSFIWKFVILFGIGLICYILGMVKFERKDLPL